MDATFIKVLMVIDHAPDYREEFLRELSKKIDLTVVAQPCEPDGLSSPGARKGYRYIELSSINFLGFYWQRGLSHILKQEYWDIVCFGTSTRHIERYALFLRNPGYWKKWVWRGLIFGRNNMKILGLLRRYFFKRASALLVYSEGVAERVKYEYGVKSVSFNNTQVRKDDFRKSNFNNNSNVLRMLFVGTNKPRKKLERLIQLADRRKDVRVRLIGPGMDKLVIPQKMKEAGQIEIFERKTGKALNPHFDWADIAVSPGNVGLLVMNTAQHGKGIVIDQNSYHGPELMLAKESGQPFISFEDINSVDHFINDLIENRWKLQNWGKEIQSVAKEKYTIENMALEHLRVFESVVNKNKRKQNV